MNPEKSRVELSLLPSDTGKPDVFSASPEPPLLNREERKEGAEERDLKGEEKKRQKRKEKNQKGQEEAELSSQEKKEPQKSQRSRQGKRERQEPAREQASTGGSHLASPRLLSVRTQEGEEKLIFLHSPFQERVNKRPKKSGAPEEDDSGVDVYYREGEDETEQPGVPPKVRVTAEGRERLFREELLASFLKSCAVQPRPRYLIFCKTGGDGQTSASLAP